MERNDLNHKVQKLCNVAIKYAKVFDKTFNYSEENIKELEEILDYYANDLRDKKTSGMKRRYRQKTRFIRWP